jgi:hypothetical protein
MDLIYIIVYSSVLIWLIPPFRQYRGNYFYFFTVLGLEGLASVLFSLLFHFNIFKIYNIIDIALLFTLVNTIYIKKYWYSFFILLTVILLINYYSDNRLIILSIILTHLLIFYIILKNAAIDYNKSGSLKIGFFVLLLYEITVQFKFYLALRNIHPGISFFYMTTAFETIIAIFFIIYKVEKSPRIRLKLRPKK